MSETYCPKCKTGILEKSKFESTFTDSKYRCSGCEAMIHRKTGIGKIAQLSPLVIAGAILSGVFTGEIGDVVDELDDFI